MAEESPKKRGRPPTERGAYNPNKQRQLGRVSDEDWETLQEAAKRAEMPFSQWALAILNKAAKRELGHDKDRKE